MAEVKILYEDKDIIVVVKPAGMASQEERSADMDMVSWLKNYFVREKKVKGMPYIGVIHRAVSWFMPKHSRRQESSVNRCEAIR